MAVKYSGKSVAEQNSVSLAWEILMQPEYGDLLSCICADEDEFFRFRQVSPQARSTSILCPRRVLIYRYLDRLLSMLFLQLI